MKKVNYKAQIEELDKTLSVLKEGWEKSDIKEKNKWAERMNALLDQRWTLMQLRDEPKPKKIKHVSEKVGS